MTLGRKKKVPSSWLRGSWVAHDAVSSQGTVFFFFLEDVMDLPKSDSIWCQDLKSLKITHSLTEKQAGSINLLKLRLACSLASTNFVREFWSQIPSSSIKPQVLSSRSPRTEYSMDLFLSPTRWSAYAMVKIYIMWLSRVFWELLIQIPLPLKSFSGPFFFLLQSKIKARAHVLCTYNALSQ